MFGKKGAIKKVSAITVVIGLLLALFAPWPVAAQGEIRILDSSVATEFPDSLTFKLSLESAVNITDIRLRYKMARESFADVTSEAYIDFTPSKKVAVSWTLEMLKIGGLPPGALIDYWWLVTDASGGRLTTEPSEVNFSDFRYPWLSLKASGITLYWYDGDQAFAEELMASAEKVLAKLREDTGATLVRPVELYIYANYNDLIGAMINPQEWTGGVAFSRYGIIIIGIAQDRLSWGKGAVAHELTHLVISQMTSNPYNDLPTWLDEGLAMYTEGVLGPEYVSYLNKAIANNSLISVRSLASPFSANSAQSYLSYAESFTVVDFLISKYGQEKMLELLLTFKGGSSYDDALKKVYGFDMDELNSLWQSYLTKTVPSPRAERVPQLASSLATNATLILVLILGIRRIRVH